MVNACKHLSKLISSRISSRISSKVPREEKGNPAWEPTYLETQVYHMKLLMYLIYQ